MESLKLDRATLDAMHAHGRAAHPDECCGAVVERDGRDLVHRFTNVQNRLHAENPVETPRDACYRVCTARGESTSYCANTCKS